MSSIDSKSFKYGCKNFITELNFDEENPEKRPLNVLYSHKLVGGTDVF